MCSSDLVARLLDQLVRQVVVRLAVVQEMGIQVVVRHLVIEEDNYEKLLGNWSNHNSNDNLFISIFRN